jgi:L-threonylcarbamoyladenylate synthase
MKREIQLCTEVLRRGGTILYPTDTVWGIGCDATDAGAVDKVYRIKSRTDSKAMLVLVDSIEMVSEYVEEIPEVALDIIEVNDSPLTIIYPGARGLAGNLPGKDGSIGIRITSEPFSRALIKTFGRPVVSSSANLAGLSAPANFAEIPEDIRSAVDYVADWRRDERKKNKPSGILKVHLNGEIQIIRR